MEKEISKQDRADAWKEISTHHAGLAFALKALKAEFPESALRPVEIRQFADAWRARAENREARS